MCDSDSNRVKLDITYIYIYLHTYIHIHIFKQVYGGIIYMPQNNFKFMIP